MVSVFEEYLDSLADGPRAEFRRWFDDRPEAVRAMVRRFPPGSCFHVEGAPAYVVTYPEFLDGAAGVCLSRINPAVDHDGAMAARFLVCPDHLKE